MIHYMELLATNQPWNLIILMAIPVILAQTIAVTELFLLFGRDFDTKLRTVNRFAGIIAGLVLRPDLCLSDDQRLHPAHDLGWLARMVRLHRCQLLPVGGRPAPWHGAP
jgi:hypothetical protein